MRVAVVTRIYRPEPAAASLFLGAVVDALLSAGHEVEVLTAAPPEGMSVSSRGERIRSAPVLRDRSGYVRGYAGYLSFDVPLAFRLLFLRRPQVVLVEPPPTTGAVVRLICTLRRIRYVYDAADIWSDAAQLEGVPGWVLRALRAVERFALRGASHIVTVSNGVAERIRELGARCPVTVTGFGADVHEFPVMVREREPVFVYAGSYSPYHGADIFIDGFARFLTTHPGHSLRFIGNGVERPRLQERAAELGISDSIDYLDPIPPQALVPHLASALASLASIKPDTVYEYSYASKAFSALNVGCPVLFTGPGPTIDLIENANRHVRAGMTCGYDAESVADAMRRLADDAASPEERQALGRWAAQNHSLQSVAQAVSKVVVGSPESAIPAG